MNARMFLKQADKNDIMKVINRVNGFRARTVLEQRYVFGKSWKYISAHTDLNMAWVRKIHINALESVQQILDAMEEAE